MITHLLVANRGETACRVMRTAKAAGLTTVTVSHLARRTARYQTTPFFSPHTVIPSPLRGEG